MFIEVSLPLATLNECKCILGSHEKCSCCYFVGMEKDRPRKVQSVYKPLIWWISVIWLGWHCCLPFKCKMFLWRVIIGGFPLGDALVCQRITNGTCFFCTMELEHSRYRFITCPIARDIWKFINAIWMSISSVAKSPFNWVFA